MLILPPLQGPGCPGSWVLRKRLFHLTDVRGCMVPQRDSGLGLVKEAAPRTEACDPIHIFMEI